MHNKSYTGNHSEYTRRGPQTPSNKHNKMAGLDMEEMATELIWEQVNQGKQLELEIRACQIQIEAEKTCRVDHGPYTDLVEREVEEIRAEETSIKEQIRNCQLVQGGVTPMEYYLWKKKQRINTYDVSIAELCKEIEAERDELERAFDQYREEGEEHAHQIEKLQELITHLNSSSGDRFPQPHSPTEESDSTEELFAINIKLKDEYSSLSSTYEILQENKEIVVMQISDNIRSIESSLKNYLDSEKVLLVKEFKQIQKASKLSEVSQVSSDDQNYKIEPLLADYAYKLKDMVSTAPEDMKKIVTAILQPLAWEKFHWRDFLEVEPKSEQIYSEYRKLEAEYMTNEQLTEKAQKSIVDISHELVMQKMRSTELSENIRKMRKKLRK